LKIDVTPAMKARAVAGIAQSIATLETAGHVVEVVWSVDVVALVRITEKGMPQEVLIDPLDLLRELNVDQRPSGASIH
jgi:hypothetical protein